MKYQKTLELKKGTPIIFKEFLKGEHEKNFVEFDCSKLDEFLFMDLRRPSLLVNSSIT